MRTHKYTEQEIKFTAILYATREEIVEYVRTSGKLPKLIPMGGFPTAVKVISRTRGFNPILCEQEQLVYDAIIREKRLPAGGAVFIQGCRPIYALEANQTIEICPPPRTEDWE
ncbi:MAG: hypothetical protein JEZ00_15285 [Anaerolineaceae bacterium]|nr:hypothetical protein [Anaerolineaceae bacterium]